MRLRDWIYTVFGVCVVLVSATGWAQSGGGDSWCRVGYRFDAYWYGVHQEVLGEDAVWPVLAFQDDGCVTLGRHFARNELVDQRRCRDAFLLGHSEGMDSAWTQSGPSDPNNCQIAGFRAGEAQLASEARLRARDPRFNESEEACLKEYREGYAWGLRRLGERRRFGRWRQICYGAGYFDAYTFLGVL